MSDQDLSFLIQQARKLSPIEQQILIQAVTTNTNEEPLTDKEKQFIDISKEHLTRLKETNKKLDKIIGQFE